MSGNRVCDMNDLRDSEVLWGWREGHRGKFVVSDDGRTCEFSPLSEEEYAEAQAEAIDA